MADLDWLTSLTKPKKDKEISKQDPLSFLTEIEP